MMVLFCCQLFTDVRESWTFRISNETVYYELIVDTNLKKTKTYRNIRYCSSLQRYEMCNNGYLQNMALFL